MQDTQFQEFDQQIRSMLADAEAKPSRRVWKGVSARLGASAAPAAASWGWVRWAGLSLAAVAAVAIGIFLSTTRTSIPTIIHNPEQAQLALSGDTPAASKSFDASVPVPVQEVPAPAESSRPAVRQSLPGRPASEPAVLDDSQGQPVPEDPATAAAEQPQASPASTAGRKPARRPARPAFDPFQALDLEPVPVRAAKPRPTLYAQGSVGSNEATFRSPMGGALMAPGGQYGFTELGASSYSVPITVGLGVRIYATPRLSIGTGVDYTLLSRTFAGSYADVPGTVHHRLQYIGIPVQLYYDIVSSNRIKFYAYGGGKAEYCIDNTYKLFGSPDIVRTYKVDGLQFSVDAGLGVEFLLSRRVGLYVDPGVSYYFPCNQPRSLRTEKPLLLNFDVGLRFNF